MAHGTYVVQAAESRLELGPHLDQHVEVTGTLEVIPPHDASESGGKQGNPPPAATAPRTGAVAPSVPGSRAEAPVPGRAPLQRVVAATIKTVATSCP
jgi:hypothetical protein